MFFVCNKPATAGEGMIDNCFTHCKYFNRVSILDLGNYFFSFYWLGEKWKIRRKSGAAEFLMIDANKRIKVNMFAKHAKRVCQACVFNFLRF